jgi:hypothetical protein
VTAISRPPITGRPTGPRSVPFRVERHLHIANGEVPIADQIGHTCADRISHAREPDEPATVVAGTVTSVHHLAIEHVTTRLGNEAKDQNDVVRGGEAIGSRVFRHVCLWHGDVSSGCRALPSARHELKLADSFPTAEVVVKLG